MNASNAKFYLPLVKALADGKTIQIRPTVTSDCWLDVDDSDFANKPEYYRVKPVELLQPPAPFTLHNPDNLTAEQVGEGYRLLCKEEIDGETHTVKDSSFWLEGEWTGGPELWWNMGVTIRVPASVPWPEKVEPEWIPLDPDDVPWGSVFRETKERNDPPWEVLIVGKSSRGVSLDGVFESWIDLMVDGWQVLLPGETEWRPCKKKKP